MPEKPNKTEQGRRRREAEKASRQAATQKRRDSAAAAQSRSEQRKGRNVDEGSAEREASFSAREAAAGLYLAGNDPMSGRRDSAPSFSEREAAAGLYGTMSGRVAARSINPDFPPVGTPLGNDEFISTNNVGGGGGGGSIDSFLFYFADGTTLTLGPDDDIYENIDENVNWSLKFTVESGAITNDVPLFDNVVDRFDGDAATTTDQTFYRVNLIYGGVAVCTGGVFRENIFCAGSRGAIAEFIKIG